MFFALQISAAVLVLAERKVAAFSQQRLGPYRVGRWGILQPLADIVKLIFKEELRPKAADFWLFYLAPVISATTAFAAFVVDAVRPDRPTSSACCPSRSTLQGADVNVAVLVIFAITSMGVYGIVLAGWASQQQVLAARRPALVGADARPTSCPTALALASVHHPRQLAVAARDRRRAGAHGARRPDSHPAGSCGRQLFGFFIYMIAGVAETNRAPFDFPEAEQELVAGYHTEYSSMCFALFFLAEYINMVTVSAVATNLFLGGWHWPLPLAWGWRFGVAQLAAEGRVPAVLLHLDAVDAAALSLRPADGVRLEVAAAGGGDQPAARRRPASSTSA